MGMKDRLHHRRVGVEQCGELKDKTVAVNRVAKVVKGGRRFSFSALVVTGDGRGHIGVGLGKAGEVPDAIRKASEQARKTLIRIPLKGMTVPHNALGQSGASSVLMRPAQPGTGVIAGSVVRSVIEAVGIKDIKTKCLGSSNPHNVLKATLDGLLKLKEPEVVASMRGISIEELAYKPF
jgi:small subunit ribosomal protein S5